MLRRLLELTPRERVLLAAGTMWVVTARAALVASRSGSFRVMERRLDALSGRLPRLAVSGIDEAVWAVTAAARRTPGTRCLAFAVALRGLLAQAGIASELRIGVAAGETRTPKAHAWVECQGRALSWGDDVEGYELLRARLGVP
jgi:hypothetical protein